MMGLAKYAVSVMDSPPPWVMKRMQFGCAERKHICIQHIDVITYDSGETQIKKFNKDFLVW
jgi:hypothetical protein